MEFVKSKVLFVFQGLWFAFCNNVDIFLADRVSPSSMATVSADALRAGRALISMSQDKLAHLAGLSVPTLRKIEKDQVGVSVEAVRKVQEILERHGVEFTFETTDAYAGVRLRKIPK